MLGFLLRDYFTPVLIASATAALAIVTVNDVAAFSAVITVGLVSFYVAIRTAKSTLDKAEEKTVLGELKRLRKANREQANEIDLRDGIIETQRKHMQYLREQIRDVNAGNTESIDG